MCSMIKSHECVIRNDRVKAEYCSSIQYGNKFYFIGCTSIREDDPEEIKNLKEVVELF